MDIVELDEKLSKLKFEELIDLSIQLYIDGDLNDDLRKWIEIYIDNCLSD